MSNRIEPIEPGSESGETTSTEVEVLSSDVNNGVDSCIEPQQILKDLISRFQNKTYKRAGRRAGSTGNTKPYDRCLCQLQSEEGNQKNKENEAADITREEAAESAKVKENTNKAEDPFFCYLCPIKGKEAVHTKKDDEAGHDGRDKGADYNDKEEDHNDNDNDKETDHNEKEKDSDPTAKYRDSGDTDKGKLEEIERLLDRLDGTDINRDAKDEEGETLLHKLARCRHRDVAQLLIDKGVDVNQADKYGRQPLHVAASMNFHKRNMVKFLLDNKADISATDTYGRTAMTFAAANNAFKVLKVLHDRENTLINKKDDNGRTPLMVAALGDRSISCKILLGLGARVDVIDKHGEPCIAVMLAKMPAVARIALDRFHRFYDAKRSQHFDLHHLEPQKPKKLKNNKKDEENIDNEDNNAGYHKMETFTPMEIVVYQRQFESLEHPVFSELMDVKWQKFGKFLACLYFVLDLTFNILWTALALIKPDARACYYFPEDILRAVLWIIAIGFTVFLVILEVREFIISRRELRVWTSWKRHIIEVDKKQCHPKWPSEDEWLNDELEEIKKVKSHYLLDFWNIFDWLVYISLFVCIILHFVDIIIVSDELCWPDSGNDTTRNTTAGPVRVDVDELESRASFVHIRFFSITIIFVWVRILKSARAFTTLGHFIAMCHKILGDVARFTFLYFVFYIPYTSAFWMMFGGDVEEFETISETLFSLFRMTLVDEYNYEGLKEENPVMCDILVGTYLAISAIVLLNLLIAVLSSTFSRVHDNAHSNALMERAKIILGLEHYLPAAKKNNFYNFIHSKCNPKKKFYDDDETIEREEKEGRKVTVKIKKKVTKRSKDITKLQQSITEIESKIDKILSILEESEAESESSDSDSYDDSDVDEYY